MSRTLSAALRRFRPGIEALESRLVPANSTTPGALAFPYPTINNISVEWLITGDDDVDATVGVRYRAQGTSAWTQGMNLMRVPGGTNTTVGFSWANKFAGSIFDVQANTTYEVELSLVDPDGGSTVRTGTVRTRAVPTAMTGAPIKNATPSTLASVLAGAQPGDIIELGAGSYSAFSVSRNGQAGQPIVIRDSDGNAVINGPGGSGNAIDLTGRQYIHLDGLTIRSGRIKMNDAVSIAVTRSRIEATGDGIVAYASSSRPENFYIADNTILGPHQWVDSQLGANGADLGEGIELTGPGHVIMNNYIKGFRDNISLLEGAGAAVDQFSIDILNNDLYVGTDDGIEADYGMGNVRVMRNRITNCFVGLSSQPSLGGPTYFIRNVMYNILYSPFKLHNGSVGDVGLHNTVVKNGDAFAVYSGVAHSRGYFRNNLFIGGPGGTYGGYGNGNGKVADLASAAASSSFNYDAYGSTTGTFTGRIGSASFSSLAQMRSATTETNAVQVDLSVFNATVAFPSNPLAAEMAPADLRLRIGSPAENAALALANVNDGYSGAAPDIGAYEIGAPLPTYGPRSGSANQPPTVASAAVASPNSVNGMTTNLSVLGADDGGEVNLIYTWAATSVPSGASPSFSSNGTNGAKNTTVTFNRAGSYSFQITIRDTAGMTATSSVNVTVNQTLTSIVVSPTSASVPAGATRQFSATARDQFGIALATQPGFTWTVSGGGTINASGLFTAGGTAGGPFTVTAASGGKSGTATATITPVNAAPTVATAASASPNPVAGATTNLSVLGADDGGEANLVYTWATTGTPPAAVAFSGNGSNAAKNVTATFSRAGSYSFQVTIRDSAGLTATSNVTVTVNQTLTSIGVTPASVTLAHGGSQQFTASARDQFGVAMSATITWSLSSGVGSISPAGLYTAPATGSGTATVRAASGTVSGTAAVTVQGSSTPPAFQQGSDSNGLVVIEAENFDAGISQGGKSWIAYTATAGYSGASAMITTPNTGVNNNTGYVTASPRLDFRVNFVKTGTHYVWIRGLGPTGSDDSVHVGLDGAALASADAIYLTTGYGWTRNTMDGVVATINVTTTGIHTLNLWMREDGSIVDKLLLTTNAGYIPSGVGPAQSPRTVANGLTATYFDNLNFTGASVSRIDPFVNYNWGSGSPAPAIAADTFSARWTGKISPRYSETYTFTTTSDDGVRLWVNGQLLIDQWNDHAPTTHSGTITLQAGQLYDIKLEYYENGGGAVMKLEWASASQAREVVPASRLYI